MQRLEVSDAVRPIYGSLGVKRLKVSNYWIFIYNGFLIKYSCACVGVNKLSDLTTCTVQIQSSLKIILYNSRGGVFDGEISTSKPLLEHSTSILGVWVNHVTIHKNTTLYYRNKNKKHEGPVLGKPLVVSS